MRAQREKTWKPSCAIQPRQGNSQILAGSVAALLAALLVFFAASGLVLARSNSQVAGAHQSDA
jgi:hypothetical protein